MKRIHLWLGMLAMLGPAFAQAGIVITGTRVIYPGEQREITVQLTNNGDVPALAQAWIDEKPDTDNVAKARSPFLLSPPVTRVNPGKGQSLRIRLIEQGLPQDRESLYWLTVLELPPKPAEGSAANKLQMAFASRLKLFYRPKGLGTLETGIGALQWKVQGDELVCTNPGAFHITFVGISLDGRDVPLAKGSAMVAPRETLRLPLKGRAPGSANAVVDFRIINDFGADASHTARLSP
ncbi:Chaperone [Pseudomonas sp. FeS53a]|jgi:chaperone protein EcpD|uniref:fimbrial biogenesis chaperone n=1 Tax=Pseudomonas sp. FeS53a TaxID=1604022 RepID=UPI0005CABDF1|nr:molecular chaperone [Pseudomonas sp. FeS53a]KIV65463.1 Chaperone [Pseudomonas sp. FeS53a]